jgi:hypothetical protein
MQRSFLYPEKKTDSGNEEAPPTSLGREDGVLTPTAVSTALGRLEPVLVPAVIYLISSHLRRSRYPSFCIRLLVDAPRSMRALTREQAPAEDISRETQPLGWTGFT